jgi:hypothetical protein
MRLTNMLMSRIFGPMSLADISGPFGGSLLAVVWPEA